MPEGEGCYVFADNSFYIGELHYGAFDGQGLYVHANKDFYKGKWKKC